MQPIAAANAPSESQFAAMVDALADDPERRVDLADLLREDHPLYEQRGATTIVRMRGWVMLALARAGVSDAALAFVLEELETGIDPYLVAAAARALRSYASPSAALAPFVIRALTNIRYRDEPVSFETYGEYALSSAGTSPVRELLASLAWLGPHARGVLPELEALRAPDGGLPRKLRVDIDRAMLAVRHMEQAHDPGADACCTPPAGLSGASCCEPESRADCEPIELTVFEDHAGDLVTFREFFCGQPTIVVFFYTRCDNPMKCSLSVTKLARIQKLLTAHGLADRIQTAAITYDPAFDLPDRIRGYGQNRGVRMDAHHRMLRTTQGMNALREHFRLGVNFVGSLVNRHQIEAYILDTAGRVAASFERLEWDEHEVVSQSIEVLTETAPPNSANREPSRPQPPR
jgi:protein SCO1/2